MLVAARLLPLPCLLLGACTWIDDPTNTSRYDVDADGVPWPEDCDDRDAEVQDCEDTGPDDTGPDDTGEIAPATSCAEVLAADPGAASGLSSIEVDGTSVQVYCDMSTEGGGWTRVLGLENTGGWMDANGLDMLAGLEAAAAGEGHVNATGLDGLRAHLDYGEMRFFCQKDAVGATVHILTDDAAVLDYFSARTTTRPSSDGTFRVLGDDTSQLSQAPERWGLGEDGYEPGEWSHLGLEAGELTMNSHVFFVDSSWHYNLDSDSGRFECDDYDAEGLVDPTGTWSVWVR